VNFVEEFTAAIGGQNAK